MHINHSACMDFKSSNVSPAIVWCVYPKQHYTWLDLSADLFLSLAGGSESAISDVSFHSTWSKDACMRVQTEVMHMRCTMIMFEPAVCLCITSSRCHPSAPPHPAGRGTVRRIGGVRRSGRKNRSSSYRWTLSSQQKISTTHCLLVFM